MSARSAAVLLAALLAGAGARAQITITSYQNPKVTVYEFEDGRMQVELLSTAALKTTDMPPDQGVAVGKAVRLPAVDRWSRREMLLVSAGYATSPSDRPDGLLIANGNVASLPSRLELRASPDDPCPLRQKARLKLSGLLCVTPSGQTRIGRFSEAAASPCLQARQSGPLLVEEGRAAVCPRAADERPTHRTVICTSGARIKLIVTEAPVDLFELSQWLASDTAAPRCSWALNLSEGSSSGSLYTPKNAHQIGKKPKTIPPGSNPVASFLVVRAR